VSNYILRKEVETNIVFNRQHKCKIDLWALKEVGPFLVRDIKWVVRNGSLVNFCADSWALEQPIRSYVETLLLLVHGHGKFVVLLELCFS
jgi:hypothetical protein